LHACGVVRAGRLRSQLLLARFEPGTTEGPVFGLGAESRLNRIVFYVSHRVREMLSISDVTIKIVFEPKLAARLSISLINSLFHLSRTCDGSESERWQVTN
jgi:hypothetical protein